MMLIMGAHLFVNKNAPHVRAEHDVFVLFHPRSNDDNVYTVECIKVSRKDSALVASVIVSGTETEQLIVKALQRLYSIEPQNIGSVNRWLIPFLYRQPKISLKDVLGLSRYSPKFEYSVDEINKPLPFGLIAAA